EESNAWVKDKIAKYEAEKKAKEKAGPLKPLVDVFPSSIIPALSKPEMLQIIFFAIFAGVALVMMKKEHSEPVLKVVNGLSEMFIQMILIVMKAMPFFVFALMAGKLVEVAGDNMDAFLGLLDFLWQYSLVVVIGLLFMIVVFYPALVQLLVKKIKAMDFLRGMRVAQFTAFSTSSSMATLPVTMECVHDNLGVSERTTSFVLPIGATINMDGTSLYQGVAVVAMAQFHMIDLSVGQQVTIVLTATLASIGAAAIPSAGLVLMILVLESVGLNPAWIALIFPVDRILDMCRTVVNVTGDGAVSTIVANSEGELEEALDIHPG
ncbi:MAG: dicarboxylate/amino acid:cation symporter, partial [Flavobacteriales bacterium]|nr:dicarboxylate/amino acid:cation symporter [Flavobacteriales bacterium]